MAKFVCNVCGYVYEGDAAPEFCPICKAPASKFTKQEEGMTWASEHVVGVLLDELLPPGPLDVVFQLHAQGAVVPGVGQSAVDLAAGVDEAPALAQGHDLIHGLFGVLHIHKLLFALFCAEKTP